MQRPIVPALVCLAALGCSHRHLLLDQAPVGTRALADKTATGWRITLVVQGAGWVPNSPEEALELTWKDVGDRTQISWPVSSHRWDLEYGYQIDLRRGDQNLVMAVQNRSQEGRVAGGVAIGAVVVGIVALAVVSQHGKGSAPTRSPGPRLPGPKGPPGTPPLRVHAGSAQVQVSLPVPEIRVDSPADPLVSVEVLDEGAFPGPLSAALRPVPEGWEVELDLRSLPEGEVWKATGAGFEATGVRSGDALAVRWIATRSGLAAGLLFDLTFSGPNRTCRARVRVQ
jgi:hypothetical protein